MKLLISLLFSISLFASVPTYVQDISADASATTHTTLTFTTSNCVVGSSLFAVARVGSDTATHTVSDGTNGNWSGSPSTADVNVTDTPNTTRLSIYSKHNQQGNTKLVVSLDPSASSTVRWSIHEVTWATGTGVLDKTAGTTGSSASIASGATATTTDANEIWFGGGANQTADTFTAGTNFSWTVKATPPTNGTGKFASQIVVVSSTGAADSQMTMGNSRPWIGVVATYKSSGATVTTIRRPLIM